MFGLTTLTRLTAKTSGCGSDVFKQRCRNKGGRARLPGEQNRRMGSSLPRQPSKTLIIDGDSLDEGGQLESAVGRETCEERVRESLVSLLSLGDD